MSIRLAWDSLCNAIGFISPRERRALLAEISLFKTQNLLLTEDLRKTLLANEQAQGKIKILESQIADLEAQKVALQEAKEACEKRLRGPRSFNLSPPPDEDGPILPGTFAG